MKESVWCDTAHCKDAIQILLLCPTLPFCRLDVVFFSVCIYFRHKKVVPSAIQIYSFKSYSITYFAWFYAITFIFSPFFPYCPFKMCCLIIPHLQISNHKGNMFEIMCYETNIILNSVRQHNHFITRGNYKATCFDYSLVIFRPIFVNWVTIWDVIVFTSMDYIKLDSLSQRAWRANCVYNSGIHKIETLSRKMYYTNCV